MTRILSYNILLGGTPRIEQLTSIIRSTSADVVGLVEATDPNVIEELARRLDMQFCLSGQGKHDRDWHLGVLSRLPITQVQVHTRPNSFTRRHLLEVCVEEPGGRQVAVFVVHLTASFHRGRESNRTRRVEVQEILSIMSERRDTPHLLMGDFNSLAPGDSLKASSILRYFLLQYPESGSKKKAAKFVQPTSITGVSSRRRTIAQIIVQNPVLSSIVNVIGPRYAQGGIDLLLKAGYVDCFRRIHPHARGYTCPAPSPAGRIDFIFASPELARSLTTCDIVTEGEEVYAAEASDHLPVLAEFSAE